MGRKRLPRKEGRSRSVPAGTGLAVGMGNIRMLSVGGVVHRVPSCILTIINYIFERIICEAESVPEKQTAWSVWSRGENQ